MSRIILGIVKSSIILALLGGLVVLGYVAYSRLPGILDELAPKKRAELQPGQEVVVVIPKGATLSQVGALLEEKGVISSRLVFKLVAWIRGEQRKIQAGEYVLKSGSDAGEVLDLLIAGKTRMLGFTVPEGYDLVQIAQVFEQGGVMSREEFFRAARDKEFLRELGILASSLEGYLFPDTYFVKPSEKSDGKALIRRMVKRFHEVYDSEVRPMAEKGGMKTNVVVTLASLIEKEATAQEHRNVSAVFHNRLNKGIALQCDPTVIYGIKPMGSKITYEDLRRDHPYNTYRHKGLPPGPIANPGKASLIAAVDPAKVEYLYFVARNDGTHHFSNSLEEHNRAVNKYQRSAQKQGPKANVK